MVSTFEKSSSVRSVEFMELDHRQTIACDLSLATLAKLRTWSQYIILLHILVVPASLQR
jgi:hypothetical protein